MNNHIALVFTVSLIIFPITNISAEEMEATALIKLNCGVTITKAIDLGTLVAGKEGLEASTFFKTSGPLSSTISLAATDWTGIDGIVHLLSEVTRYTITTDGKESKPTSYITKSSLGSAGESIILTSNAGPIEPVKLSLQISDEGDNLKAMPYSGEITQTLTFTVECND